MLHEYHEDPYILGFEAYCEGKELYHNPFTHETQEYYDWRAGWNDAADKAGDAGVDYDND